MGANAPGAARRASAHRPVDRPRAGAEARPYGRPVFGAS